MDIRVIPGEVCVEAISGNVQQTHFLLYITLRPKQACGSCHAIEGGQSVCLTESGENPTYVDITGLEGHWACEMSVSDNTCVVVGVRDEDDSLRAIPFSTLI